jgi:hypothetical protein
LEAAVMQYALLVYDDESAVAAAGAEEVAGMLQRHKAFARTTASRVVTSRLLRPSHTATSVRRIGDAMIVTDGTFTETEEILGGLYLIEATDLDDALTLAKQLPTPWCGVEVRPVWPDSA